MPSTSAYDNAVLSQVITVTGDKAGLNTSNPTAQLHVVGSGLFASGLIINNQTASTIASFDASKNVVSLPTATYPSLTELTYVKGVTSAIQTQLDSKQAILTNPVTGVGVSGYAARWVSSSGVSSGIIYDNTSRVGIRTASPTHELHVVGSGFIASGLNVNALLTLNGTGVSVVGHTHTSSDITDFNSSVSGLIPVKNVTGSGYVNVSSSSGIYNIAVTGLQPSGNYANSTHSHGNITNDGQIGTAAGLVVTTDISGVLITTAVGGGLVIEDSTLLVDQPYLNSVYAAFGHIHGNITNSGAIGSASGLLVITGNSGILTTSSGINSSLISNFTEAVQDVVGSGFILAGSGIIVSYNDAGNSFTVSTSGGGGGGITGVIADTSPKLGGNLDLNSYAINGTGNVNISGSGLFASGLNIANQTASTIASFDANKNISSLATATYPSLTELSYVKGVTSAVQTQLNNKQATLTNPVTGTGTANYLSKWTSASGIGNSLIYDDGTNIGIGTTTPSGKLHVVGSGVIVSGVSSDRIVSPTGTLIIAPITSGALIASLGGNPRGSGSVDLQMNRSSASQVASGNRTFIGAGIGNSISVDSTDSCIVAGANNTINSVGLQSMIGGGNGNTIDSSYSVIVAGTGNYIAGSSQGSIIGAGLSNTISTATVATIPGGYRAKATRYGELSHAAGYFAQNGDAQHTILIARRVTTDATANTVLTLDGGSGISADKLLVMPLKSTWTFIVKLSAYNDTDSAGAGWIFKGSIRKDGASATSIIGSIIEENWKESAMNSTSADVVANSTYGALDIRVTGLAAKNIRWVAVVDISQVSYGTP